MEAVSTNTLFNSHGKINFFGWIVFLGTLFTMGYAIYQLYLSINKMNRDEEIQGRKMMELEMNLREIRGAQYKESK